VSLRTIYRQASRGAIAHVGISLSLVFRRILESLELMLRFYIKPDPCCSIIKRALSLCHDVPLPRPSRNRVIFSFAVARGFVCRFVGAFDAASPFGVLVLREPGIGATCSRPQAGISLISDERKNILHGELANTALQFGDPPGIVARRPNRTAASCCVFPHHLGRL